MIHIKNQIDKTKELLSKPEYVGKQFSTSIECYHTRTPEIISIDDGTALLTALFSSVRDKYRKEKNIEVE